MRRAVPRAALAALALLCACGSEGSPIMAPGEDCLRCHGGGGGGGEGDAPAWTVAGTVFPSSASPTDAGVLGAYVHLRDANGWQLALRTNAAGNFYTAESVAFPLRVCVEWGGASTCMTAPVDRGGCNACHAVPPRGGAAGRIFTP